MAFNGAREETTIQLWPEGAVLVQDVGLIELGKQPIKSYGNKDDGDSDAEEVRYVETAAVILETVTARVAATGKPFEMAIRVNMESLGEKSTQRQLAEAMGIYKKPFDITAGLGKALQVKVKHKEVNGKKFANIVGYAPLGEGQEALIKPPKRKLLLWEIDSSDIKELADLPRLFGQKIEDLVKESQEWKQRCSRTKAAPATPAPIPQAQPPVPPVSTNGNGAAAKPRPRPRAVLPPPGDDERFLFSPDGDELTVWTAKDLQKHIDTNQLDPRTVEVCREDEDAMRLASEYGFVDPIPF
jgi:hypothetical protein